MKKVIMLLVLVSLMVGTAYAASVKCTVTGVDAAFLPEGTSNVVTLECDNADAIKLGQEVKVKIKKTKTVTTIEGC